MVLKIIVLNVYIIIKYELGLGKWNNVGIYFIIVIVMEDKMCE